MQRWHKEKALMFRRWKIEMMIHRYDWRNPPTDPEACHCAKGIGSMRKRTPAGHRRRCCLCNPHKCVPKARQNKEYRALAFELNL